MGGSVIYFIKECKSKTVIAYEPHPIFYRFLEANVRINNLHNRVVYINKAVSSSKGKKISDRCSKIVEA